MTAWSAKLVMNDISLTGTNTLHICPHPATLALQCAFSGDGGTASPVSPRL